MSDLPSGDPASPPEAEAHPNDAGGSQPASHEGPRRPRRAAAERGASWRHEFEQQQYKEELVRQVSQNAPRYDEKRVVVPRSLKTDPRRSSVSEYSL